MKGWKLVMRLAEREFISCFAGSRLHRKHYFLGVDEEDRHMPLFFFSLALTGADLVHWLGLSSYPFALLYVEAQEPCRAIFSTPRDENTYDAFWQAWRDGVAWPTEQGYRAPDHTYVTTRLRPLTVAWSATVNGLQTGLAAKIEAAMRATIRADPSNHSLFFPTIRR
jgi:hypothetical protein